MRIILFMAAALLLPAGAVGCGENMEDEVRDGWEEHGYLAYPVKTISEVKCVEERTLEVDGWCSVPFDDMTARIPYRDGELLWGEIE